MFTISDKVTCRFINPDSSRILIIEPATMKFDSLEWIDENKNRLEKALTSYGGVVLRNFNIHSISEFNKLVNLFSQNPLDYTYRSTPRTKLGGKIYTATEYPANRSIPLHNENSYTKKWPEKIFFFSVVVAQTGGETPIADSRNVYARIDTSIKNKFERHGVMYVRNYNQGIDLSWQEVFQTNQKDTVSKFCEENQIKYAWKERGAELMTMQVCQAVLCHPTTYENVWFNQAHLFHPSSLENCELRSLINEVGEDNLPRNAFYGDGSIIENDALEQIREAYDKEKIKFQWHKNDVMILDNILTAHGREPYTGDRKVAVAMT